MLKMAIPLLHISIVAAAQTFFCDRLGFRLASAMRPPGVLADPCFLTLEQDGVCLMASSYPGGGVPGSIAAFLVDDVHALHADFAAKGLPIGLAPTDHTWGNREMYLKDARGNSLRFLQEPTR